MNQLDNICYSSIRHHGIKGQKWGVRRSPQQLGHYTRAKNSVANSEKSATIAGEIYRSTKGFITARNKLTGFCLRPGAKHSKEFFDVGYKENDSELLFKHLEDGFDLMKKRDVHRESNGAEKFSIPMKLGVTIRRTFNTAWQKDFPDAEVRFISAYIDRRVKEDD